MVTSSVSVERHCAELDDVLVGVVTVSRRITVALRWQQRLMCQLRECSPVVGDRDRMLLSIVPIVESLWNRCRDQHYLEGACDTPVTVRTAEAWPNIRSQETR